MSKNLFVTSDSVSSSFRNATGPIDYGFTNDYMFRTLLQQNHHLYSDKFTLGVVDLTHIELATDEDSAYGIDRWARLFKSTTWEELKMIAENNPIFTEASENLYRLNADEIARQRSRTREDYIARQNALNHIIEDISAENERLRAQLAKYENLNVNRTPL